LDCFDRSRRGEPPTRATNAAFGYGADGNLLYLTAGKFVYAIRMAKQG
jgi:hypothetical protein